MNIWTLNGLIAAIALVVTLIIGLAIQKPKNWLIAYIRYFLGTFFIFSGVVKAIDPIGTAIKMEDYFNVFSEYLPALDGFWHFWAEHALGLSVFMIVLEIALGISMILGTLPKLTLFLYAGIVIFFTFLTGFSHWTGKVTDCGCFGDFVKLKPFESFCKDIFLSVLVLLMIIFQKHITLLFKKTPSLVLLALLTIGTYFFTMSNYYNLPIVDFRAYKNGVNLIEGMNDGTEGKVSMMYTLTNTQSGETKKVSSDVYISEGYWKDTLNWKLDKSNIEKIVIEEPQLPTIKDFIIADADGHEVQDSLLHIPGFQFWVVAYNVQKLNNDGFSDINRLMSEAKKANIPVNGITSSALHYANPFSDNLYNFYLLDATPIKTMMRANPGLVLVKDGVLLDKWHGKHLPSYAELKQKYQIP